MDWKLAFLSPIGAVLIALFVAAIVENGRTWLKRYWYIPMFLVLAYLGVLAMLSLTQDGTEDQVSLEASPTPTRTQQPTHPPNTATPIPTERAPSAARCDDLLPSGSCEKPDPSEPDVRLEVTTVSIDEDRGVTFAVTLRNGSSSLVTESQYGISSWHAVADDGRVYRVEDALSDDSIREFLLVQNESASGFVRLEDLGPNVRSFTLALPPFGTVGPFVVDEAAIR